MIEVNKRYCVLGIITNGVLGVICQRSDDVLYDVQIYSGFSPRVMLKSHVYANKCGRKDYGDYSR